jgi:signal transduction histidine kinase
MIITNNHKGTMEVISEPDQGACFIVYLPLARNPSLV